MGKIRVFVSHAFEDRSFVDDRLVPTLKSNGLDAWYSEERILIGIDWEREIRKSLTKCQWFICVVSKHALASEWVRAEVCWAHQHRRQRLVPVSIDGTVPENLFLPLNQVQYVDLSDDSADQWRKLLRRIIKRVIVDPGTEDRGKGTDPISQVSAAPRRNRHLITIAIAVAATALVATLGFRSSGPQAEPGSTPGPTVGTQLVGTGSAIPGPVAKPDSIGSGEAPHQTQPPIEGIPEMVSRALDRLSEGDSAKALELVNEVERRLTQEPSGPGTQQLAAIVKIAALEASGRRQDSEEAYVSLAQATPLMAYPNYLRRLVKEQSIGAWAPHLASVSERTHVQAINNRFDAMDAELKRRIADQIWENECDGSIEGLTSWNEGEQHASLGIGHFIWYPEGRAGPFVHSFPQFVAFATLRRIEVPDWIKGNCPWRSIKDFLSAKNSRQMKELREFLRDHRELQMEFMVYRLEQALPNMLDQLPDPAERLSVLGRYEALSRTPAGMYAAIDYVNFKGEGVDPRERYRGQGWGLLQVLQEMEGQTEGAAAVTAFARSAETVLTRRVSNSPPDRKERQWLRGWTNRIHTYLVFGSP